MANTYVKIASALVGAGGASSIDFSSIPQTYTDLLLKVSAKSNRGTYYADLLRVDFNGLSTNQSSILIESDSVSVTSFSLSTTQLITTTTSVSTANTFSNCEIYIPNYAGSTYKSISADSTTENNGTNGPLYIGVGLWSSTSAITKITLTDVNSSTIQQYSTATLYGIKNS